MPSVAFNSTYAAYAYPSGVVPDVRPDQLVDGRQRERADSDRRPAAGRRGGGARRARAGARRSCGRSRSWRRSTRGRRGPSCVAARAAWEATAGTVQQAQRAYQIAERALHARRVHAARAVGLASAAAAGRSEPRAGRARSAGGARARRAAAGPAGRRTTGGTLIVPARQGPPVPQAIPPHAAGRQPDQKRVVAGSSGTGRVAMTITGRNSKCKTQNQTLSRVRSVHFAFCVLHYSPAACGAEAEKA